MDITSLSSSCSVHTSYLFSLERTFQAIRQRELLTADPYQTICGLVEQWKRWKPRDVRRQLTSATQIAAKSDMQSVPGDAQSPMVAVLEAKTMPLSCTEA